MAEDDIDPDAIRESVMLDRARGGRWRQTEAGGYERLTSLQVLADRGRLSAAALSGADSYRRDYLQSIESASMRSTLYARSGGRDDEDEVLERAQAAARNLAALHRDVVTSGSARQLLAELCGRGGASPTLERKSIACGVPRLLEAVADWYEAHDLRDTRDIDTEEMQRVDLDGWWLLARAFNPRMSREALEAVYHESGLAQLHDDDAQRAVTAASVASRLQRVQTSEDIEASARRMFEEFARRFRLRADQWRLLGEGEKRRWRDAAEGAARRVA